MASFPTIDTSDAPDPDFKGAVGVIEAYKENDGES